MGESGFSLLQVLLRDVTRRSAGCIAHTELVRSGSHRCVSGQRERLQNENQQKRRQQAHFNKLYSGWQFLDVGKRCRWYLSARYRLLGDHETFDRSRLAGYFVAVDSDC